MEMKTSKTRPEPNEKTGPITSFETLASLFVPLYRSQCVFHKHEILICGGHNEKDCYSYHTIKNQYKRICSYPKNTIPWGGHTVLKRIEKNDPNAITLLSFGGQFKHTLVMKYTSVWNNDQDDEMEMEKEKRKGKPKYYKYNEWFPFMNRQNYTGVRAVIGGNDNHLLFITYYPKNIDVFDLNIFQYVNCSTLPIGDYIQDHCFVLKTEDALTIPMKTNVSKKMVEMLLFCKAIGLSIEYDEDKRIFKFNPLRVCSTIRPFYSYAYACVNDIVLFFGGYGGADIGVSNTMYKYSMSENKWTQFEQTLPIPLHGCVGIFNSDHTCVHIIGGIDDKKDITAAHAKINVNSWAKEMTKKELQWIQEEGEKEEIEQIKTEIEKMVHEPQIKKLKVDFFFIVCFVCDYIASKDKQKDKSSFSCIVQQKIEAKRHCNDNRTLDSITAI
ncbi:hypothetical protein RFI_08346 [Reticulomyxa filosa]|uniref:Kelch motif family protein n=1 Tax=Reticulomyxa filosa TaxID=46433 RepID=X6NR40_RETFI|nr:hypothetical protein RFI_08346 [Reticulomyxa filosa]|eukprot:ETO28780.1 hypothetical protein RFI_08346 [Reticulomyxa filosa]